MLRTIVLALAGVVAAQVVPAPNPTSTWDLSGMEVECSVDFGTFQYQCHAVDEHGTTSSTSSPIALPTQTYPFTVPKHHFARKEICHDFKEHSDDDISEPPWAIDGIRQDIPYFKDLKAIERMISQSMDLFEQHRNQYLEYMATHPDDLTTTLRVIKDVNCAIDGVGTVRDSDNREQLTYLLWQVFTPRKRYEGIFRDLLFQLETISSGPDPEPNPEYDFGVPYDLDVPTVRLRDKPLCPDFKQHYPGTKDPPWCKIYFREKPYKREADRCWDMAIRHMDAFASNRSEYLHLYMGSHPKELANAIKLFEDLHCAMTAINGKMWDESGFVLSEHHTRVSTVLRGWLKPRGKFDRTVPVILKALQDLNDKIKAPRLRSFKVPKLKLPLNEAFCQHPLPFSRERIKEVHMYVKKYTSKLDAEYYLAAWKTFKNVSVQHVDLFKQNRDLYLLYMKAHEDEIVPTMDALIEAQCDAGQGKAPLEKSMIPTLKEMVKALQQLEKEIREGLRDERGG
jgi:hypothetical protein